ncbi:hypothetical protein MKX03_016117 [Papaver bracteatum]|nr:hypothetical protein MKX03_016117 [Papaver bracteatum]
MELSSLTQENISFPFITAMADGPKHVEMTLTRSKFEELCSDLLDQLKVPELVKSSTGKDPNVQAGVLSGCSSDV